MLHIVALAVTLGGLGHVTHQGELVVTTKAKAEAEEKKTLKALEEKTFTVFAENQGASPELAAKFFKSLSKTARKALTSRAKTTVYNPTPDSPPNEHRMNVSFSIKPGETFDKFFQFVSSSPSAKKKLKSLKLFIAFAAVTSTATREEIPGATDALESAFLAEIKRLGVRVVDTPNKARQTARETQGKLADYAKKLGATVGIGGTVILTPSSGVMGTPMKRQGATATIRGYSARSGEPVVVITGNRSGMHIDLDTAARLVSEDVGKLSAQRFLVTVSLDASKGNANKTGGRGR